MHKLAGMIGWPPSELRAASLAELWAHVHGHGEAQGWWRAEGPPPMTRADVREMAKRYG